MDKIDHHLHEISAVHRILFMMPCVLCTSVAMGRTTRSNTRRKSPKWGRQLFWGIRLGGAKCFKRKKRMLCPSFWNQVPKPELGPGSHCKRRGLRVYAKLRALRHCTGEGVRSPRLTQPPLPSHCGCNASSVQLSSPPYWFCSALWKTRVNPPTTKTSTCSRYF